MKSLLFAVALLVIGVPLTALAFKHDNRYSNPPSAHPVGNQPVPQQPPTTTGGQGGTTTGTTTSTGIPSQPVGLCFNYGHDTQTYDLSANGQVAQDLQRLSAGGVHCIRLAYNGFNNQQSESLALFAKEKGFYTIVGGDWGVLSSSQLTIYDQEVLQEAKWAQANGIPELGIGNEQEARLSSISVAQWADNLRTLAEQVRQVYAGRISYSLDADYLSQYEAAIPQAPNLVIGLNSYDDPQGLKVQITSAINTWGAGNVELTEWNCDIANVSQCKTDSGLASYVAQDLTVLKGFNIPKYMFTWRSVAPEAPDYWSMVDYPQTLAELGIH